MNLTDFLLARITEDEAEASHEQAMAMVGAMPGFLNAPERVYVAEQTRVLTATRRRLADCEAKRRIVGGCSAVMADSRLGVEAWTVARRVIQDLATPYADHPDYNPEWRP